MAHTAPRWHHAIVILGLLFGAAASIWVAVAARDQSLEAALPTPWVTACLGLAVVVVGWVLANAAPRFAAALAGAAAPGAAYGAVVLAGDGAEQLAYGWSAMPIALGCLAIGAGLHGAKHAQKPWSARRSTAPRVPRARTR
jgi:peptidoglycan/LPS O-acetylase OafA/YrhL